MMPGGVRSPDLTFHRSPAVTLDDANTLAQQLNDQQLDKKLPAVSSFDPSAVGNLVSAAADGTSVVVDLAGGLAEVSGDLAGTLLEVIGGIVAGIFSA